MLETVEVVLRTQQRLAHLYARRDATLSLAIWVLLVELVPDLGHVYLKLVEALLFRGARGVVVLFFVVLVVIIIIVVIVVGKGAEEVCQFLLEGVERDVVAGQVEVVGKGIMLRRSRRAGVGGADGASLTGVHASGLAGR